jgi:ribonucleotide reductase alpha subunit
MIKIEKIEKKSDVYDIQVEENNNFFANGILVHNCNLNSINLANIHNENELQSTCETAVRLLDNAIDFTDVPIKEGEIHNNVYRTIGVGSMGLADHLAKRNIAYNKSQDVVDELFENIAYYTINTSIDLAKERGKYPRYDGSEWSKGLILGRLFYGKKCIEYEKIKGIFTDAEIKEIANDEKLLEELFKALGE